MKFRNVFQQMIIESLNQNNEIKDTLNVLFVMFINSGETAVSMNKIQEFLKQKFDIDMDVESIKKILADMDSVSEISDDIITLTQEDEPLSKSDQEKQQISDMAAKAGAEAIEDLDTAYEEDL